MGEARFNNLLAQTCFCKGALLFVYLGAPIFKGRLKSQFFQPIADTILAKLSAWKGSLISIVGRVILVQYVIQSMITHTIGVYSWSILLLKNIERASRNFIWSGNISQRKIIIVSWKKVCQPKENKGLNIRSLICLNDTSNLKLC